MSHPYAKHNEQHKSHTRVGHILKGHGQGAAKHAIGGAFSRVASKSAAVDHEQKAGGDKKPGRFARGGKVKHKGHQTNIIIAGPRSPSSPGAADLQAGAPPPIPTGAPAPPPMAGPPGAAGGPGGPPPMPMRARGGKVGGDATAGNIKKLGQRAAKNSYARGGAAKMTAGALSGVGRLEQAGKKKR